METSALITLLTAPNVPLKFGLMLVTAMFIGGFLYPKWKDLVKITWVFAVFITYQLWIHDTILDVFTNSSQFSHLDLSMTSIAMSFMVAILWLGGMFAGMLIVERTRQPFVEEREVMEARLAKLKGQEPTVPIQKNVEEKRKE